MRKPKDTANPEQKPEKPDNERVKGLKIVLDSLEKSGHGDSETARKIKALIIENQ